MNLRQLVIGITFLAVFAMALRISIDSDTWWQLRTGETIVQTASIPKTDPFSFTKQGIDWLYPSTAWLSEIQLYSLASTFGLGSLNVWTAVLATLAFLFIYLSLSGGFFLRAFALILAGATAAIYWAARPYMMSFVLTAVFLWILEDYRWGRKNRLVLLPLLMILWVNSHPGFAIGFILLAIYAADAAFRWLATRWSRRGFQIHRKDWQQGWCDLRPFAFSTLGMLAAVCINPSGARLLLYPFETVSIGVLRDFIQEWQSPDFHLIAVQPFIWLLLLTVSVLALSRKQVVLSDLLLVGVFGYMSFLAGRNIALFALVAPIVLTRHAAPLVKQARNKLALKTTKVKAFEWQRLINLGIFLLLVLAVIAKGIFVVPTEANWRAIEKAMPLGAVKFLDKERPAGNLLNSYNWGGFLIWELPSYPVFVDGRTDLYGDEFLKEYLAVVNAESGWQSELDKWNVNLVLLESSWPLTKVLPYEGWHLLYKDEISVLYGR